MKLKKRVMVAATTAILLLVTAAPATWAGAEHYEFPFTVVDYNDCTGEWVAWDVVISEVLQAHETPSGRGVFVDVWLWRGTVEGLSSGYLWTTKGTSPYVERYALDGSPAGGFFWLENSVLKPASPGAPRIKLDVDVRMAYNANGEIVVDQFNYTYDCR
jgi:hypothetical protein